MTSEVSELARHHQRATDKQNAAAVAAGAAALGAVLGLAVSTTTVVIPIAGAIVFGTLGAIGGQQANSIVKWWQRDSERDTASIH